MISLRCHTGNEASGKNKIVQGSIDFRSMCGMTDLVADDDVDILCLDDF